MHTNQIRKNYTVDDIGRTDNSLFEGAVTGMSHDGDKDWLRVNEYCVSCRNCGESISVPPLFDSSPFLTVLYKMYAVKELMLRPCTLDTEGELEGDEGIGRGPLWNSKDNMQRIYTTSTKNYNQSS